MPNSGYWKVKRVFDIGVSISVLFILSPLMVCVAMAVKLGTPGPIFFVQRRIGRNFVPFNMYKFRTMADGIPGLSITTCGDSRVTKIGRVLRRTKLDELPQFYNVLVGDMSLVGPRPEVEKYVEAFRNDYETVLEVLPGITDYAAIEYRHEEDILAKYPDPETGYLNEVLPAKIKLYKRYINEAGFCADFAILWGTILRVLR